MTRQRHEMHPEAFHVVDRTGQPDDFELAAIARACIDLANGERATEETFDSLLERTTNFNRRRVARLQNFGGDARLPNLRKQQHVGTPFRG